MKTAISLPDTLFQRSEQVARQLRISRSQLFAQALQEYLDKLDPDRITRAFNEVYASEPSELDPGLLRLQTLSLSQGEW